jgi:putative Mn2+ efflux pump MntP
MDAQDNALLPWGVIDALALGGALAMDATAVAAARGVARPAAREIVLLAAVFAASHAVMISIGWVAGAVAADAIAAWDHWIAFGLLSLLGVRALLAARAPEAEPLVAPPTWRVVALLAIATSIDAVAAGVTLPLLSIPPWASIVVVSAIVAACTLAGAHAGRALGTRLGPTLQLAGGLALIAIGVKILVEHTT